MNQLLYTCFFIVLFRLLLVNSVTAQDELVWNKYANVIACQYDEASDFTEDSLALIKKDGKWGFIDKKGNLIIDCSQYRTVSSFHNGLSAVSCLLSFPGEKKRETITKERWGYIDKTGKEVIGCRYDGAKSFSESLAAVKESGKWGYIDLSGKKAIDYQFQEAGCFSNGFAIVSKVRYNESIKYGYIDKTGNLIIDFLFADADNFTENGFASIKYYNDGWHARYINPIGKEVYNLTCGRSVDEIKPFTTNGLAAIRVEKGNSKWGYINEAGITVIDYQYDQAGQFSKNGLAPVKKWKWGYINAKGDLLIDFQFDEANSFSENGLAAVKRGEKWGFIDSTGSLVISCDYDEVKSFSENGLAAVKKDGKWGYVGLANPSERITFYVQNRIEEWQQKGEFESPGAYLQRVTEDGRKKKADELTTVAVQKIAPDYCNWENLSATYDATITNQMFEMKAQGLLPFYIKVPNNGEASAFKEALSRLQFTNVQYALNKDEQFFITKATIYNPDNYKKYRCQSSGVFEKKNIVPNFQPLDIQVTVENTQHVTTTEKTINMGPSDVDINIPINPQTNDKTFVVIIANENYLHEVPVQYAANDGEVFRQYCEKTLGIPASHIRFNKDATFGTMRSEIRWACDIMEAFSGQAKVIFYYAGHGMPNTKDNSAYLLPSDGSSPDFEVAVKLSDLYNRLSSVPSQGVTVILDACFSGATRDNGILASVRSIGIVPNTEEPTGNMVVLSATTGNETASPYTEKRHGLFTYFLLKKLQETGGKVDYKTLSDYIIRNVTQQSAIDKNITKQTPVVNVSNDIRNSWGMWNFLK